MRQTPMLPRLEATPTPQEDTSDANMKGSDEHSLSVAGSASDNNIEPSSVPIVTGSTTCGCKAPRGLV